MIDECHRHVVRLLVEVVVLFWRKAEHATADVACCDRGCCVADALEFALVDLGEELLSDRVCQFLGVVEPVLAHHVFLVAAGTVAYAVDHGAHDGAPACFVHAQDDLVGAVP